MPFMGHNVQPFELADRFCSRPKILLWITCCSTTKRTRIHTHLHSTCTKMHYNHRREPGIASDLYARLKTARMQLQVCSPPPLNDCNTGHSVNWLRIECARLRTGSNVESEQFFAVLLILPSPFFLLIVFGLHPQAERSEILHPSRVMIFPFCTGTSHHGWYVVNVASVCMWFRLVKLHN